MRRFSPFRALLVASALVSPALGQADLPKAETLLEQYVEATGGRAAYEKLKNRVSAGTLEISGANIEGKIRITQAEPGKQLSVVELGPIGKTIQGTDGEVAWEVSALTGDRVLDGEELAEAKQRADFNSEIHWKERLTKAECVAVEDVDGKPAYKVVLTPKQGKPVTEWYDKASHLIVKQQVTTKGPMGELTVENFPSDYKKVDGILIPHKSTQKVLTQEIVIKMDEVKHNVDLPADTFQPPAAIQALLKKKGSK